MERRYLQYVAEMVESFYNTEHGLNIEKMPICEESLLLRAHELIHCVTITAQINILELSFLEKPKNIICHIGN